MLDEIQCFPRQPAFQRFSFVIESCSLFCSRCVVNMTSEAREPVQEALAGFLDTLSACRTDVAALVLVCNALQ